MTVQTAALSTLKIGTTLAVDFDTLSDSAIASAIDADTLTQVGEIEDHGEFGDEASEVTFTAVSDRRVRKFKGTFNAGTIELIIGHDPNDSGQAALVTAMASDLDHNFKVELNDDLGGSGDSNTVFYFRGKIMSNRIRHGNVENVVRRVVRIGVNTKVVEIAAT